MCRYEQRKKGWVKGGQEQKSKHLAIQASAHSQNINDIKKLQARKFKTLTNRKDIKNRQPEDQEAQLNHERMIISLCVTQHHS